MAASLPKYTPIPFTGGMSVSTGTKTLEMAQNAFITEQDKKSMTKISKLFPGIVQGVIKPEDMARLQDIITKKPDGDVGMKQILQTVAEVQSK
jgi:glycine/serine hydroxymethyltransferase